MLKSRFILESLLIVSIMLATLLNANPIPVPTLMMPKEYIVIKVLSVNEAMRVRVKGVYPFSNVDYKNVTMYFPIPYDVVWETVKVYVNENPVGWRISDWTYGTVLGQYPVIRWVISPVPDEFNVTVIYEQEVKYNNSVFMFLYPMATGRFLNQTYAKQCVAEVRIHLNALTSDSEIEIATVPPPETAFMQNFITKIKLKAGYHNEITLYKASKPFTPMMEDILIAVSFKE